MILSRDQATLEFSVAEFRAIRQNVQSVQFDMQRTTLLELPVLCLPEAIMEQRQPALTLVGRSMPRRTYPPIVIRQGCTSAIKTSSRNR